MKIIKNTEIAVELSLNELVDVVENRTKMIKWEDEHLYVMMNDFLTMIDKIYFVICEINLYITKVDEFITVTEYMKNNKYLFKVLLEKYKDITYMLELYRDNYNETYSCIKKIQKMFKENGLICYEEKTIEEKEDIKKIKARTEHVYNYLKNYYNTLQYHYNNGYTPHFAERLNIKRCKDLYIEILTVDHIRNYLNNIKSQYDIKGRYKFNYIDGTKRVLLATDF